MENNDIGFTVHKHVACMFEDLLMIRKEDVERKGLLGGLFKRRDEDITEEQYIEREVRRWRANEMPLKSVIHLTQKLGIGVEVYTFMDPLFIPHIEHWLARKGADVQVYAYLDAKDLLEDFKYNRDVHTFFTTSQDDAALLGIRATCVLPDGTFGV